MGLNNFTGSNSQVTNGSPPSNSSPNNPGFGPSMPMPMGSNNGSYDPLEFLIDYNKKFANAGPTMFRDELIHQALGVLISKNKPNLIFVGMAGVGKTKIVEDIAWRLANDDPIVPDGLKSHVIYELPLSNIVAGSSFVGQTEEKLKCVVDFLSETKNKAIVFIDEIHQLVSKDSTYEKIAQILKPALARGDIRTIGATTTQEANRLQDDPALNRRFSQLIVDEFTQEQTKEILESLVPGLRAHYNYKIDIDPALLPDVVSLADEYRPAGSHRPDNAITLLDRAIGDTIINRKLMERNAANDPIVSQALKSNPVAPVTTRQVQKTAIKLMTGNAKKNDFDINHAKATFSKIKGQDEVLKDVLRLLQVHDLNLFPSNKPLTILFAGSSGTGKTEITKLIAKELTGLSPIILNMTEYHTSASINRIIGSPTGYIGSNSNQELPFDCLKSNPYQVILLDEFEKGDRSVQRLFMSAFDEGYIKTAKGTPIDFSRAIIIATTNAGHTTNVQHKVGFLQNNQGNKLKENVDTLSNDFDVELLNRFEKIFKFNDLTEDIYKEIIQSQYEEQAARIAANSRKFSLPQTIPDDDLDEIVKETYVSRLGARPAEKAVHDYIVSKILP